MGFEVSFLAGAAIALAAFLLGYWASRPKKAKGFSPRPILAATAFIPTLLLAAFLLKPAKIKMPLIAKPLSSVPTPLPAEAKAQDAASNAVLYGKAFEPELPPDGTRQYRLTASAFPWQVYPGLTLLAWGFNHQVPGPLLRLRVGEKVRFVVENQLSQTTTLHWHGLPVPFSQDGVPGVSQKVIPSGGTFIYEFTVTPGMVGTHFYHTHVNDDFQMDQGLHGVLIVDPASSKASPYDVEAVYEMCSFKAGAEAEEENTFALNGKAFPESPVLNVPLGSRVLLRLVNASAEQSHVMHLHGYTFKVMCLDGNPLEHPYKANTIMLGPSQTADVAFTADRPGSWMFQCHFLDHVMNPVSNAVRDEMREDHAICPMGGLVTFVNVSADKQASRDFQPAGSITRDPTCTGPSF